MEETRKCVDCCNIRPIIEFAGDRIKNNYVKLCRKCRDVRKLKYEKKKQELLSVTTENKKACIQCRKIYSSDQFKIAKDGNLTSSCIKCLARHQENKKKFIAENPEKNRERNRRDRDRAKELRKNNPEVREQHLKRKRESHHRTKHSDKNHFHTVKKNAKKRNIPMELQVEDVARITRMPCYYCGDHGKCGVDRKDNSASYTIDNSVPACEICNWMKLDWEYDGFLLICGHIAAFNGLDGRLCYELLPILWKSSFKTLQSGAIDRNIQVQISQLDFDKISAQNCYICNRPGPVGIDRKNNELGYVEGNCFPCCNVCNMMKSNYDLQDFLQKCQQIYRFNKDYLESSRIYETRTEQIVRKRRVKQKTE